ncbi:unnamed protein product [Trichobilharzia regenti]|nr:unnamed protein product [Trichobilharzia regenti]
MVCDCLPLTDNVAELFRLRGGIADSFDLVSNKPVKVRAKIEIPQAQFPAINFVGKLLGPGGQTLRAVQETTKTKMAILGSGSLRDEAKEKELLANGDPKYQHLKQKLHLQIDSLGPPSESCYRLAHALAEVRKLMLPVSPNINFYSYSKEQTELAVQPWSQTTQDPSIPFRGRGKSWIGRGVMKNGVGIPLQPPVTADVFVDVNPVNYPPINFYDVTEFGPHMFEEFGLNYGRSDDFSLSFLFRSVFEA